MGAFFLIVLLVVVVIIVVKKSKLAKAQEKAVQELKASDNYKFALHLIETLEGMNKGCNFGEPSIGYNYKHKHQAYAEFCTYINIPSEENKSFLTIHTTEYGYEHQWRAEFEVETSARINRGCVLDMGATTVFSSYDSQELIDGVFKVLFDIPSEYNFYVKGKLTVKHSGTLPVYPRPIEVSDY